MLSLHLLTNNNKNKNKINFKIMTIKQKNNNFNKKSNVKLYNQQMLNQSKLQNLHKKTKSI